MPTPLEAHLQVMGRTIRLETNSSAVLNWTQRVLERYGRSPGGHSEFVWRIVTEACAEPMRSWPKIAAFSEEGLRFVSIGQRSFFAVDLNALEAVGFLPEELANDEAGFASVFLATLFDMTAAALRLTPIAAACVALQNKSLLIFGPPTSGKTVSTDMAGQQGLAFHSDQATFLELEAGVLRAWGQFWPTAFRPDARKVLPELLFSFQPFTYADSTFLCLAKNPFQPSDACSVVPVACVFLERRANSMPRLSRLESHDFSERIRQALPFKEDECFEARRDAVFGVLAGLPAYGLVCGDSCVAASFYRSLLAAYDSGEAGV
jgi:hypothetical protein